MWLTWIGAFFAIELPALYRRRAQDTLSNHVWFWFDVPRRPPPRRQVRARRLGLLCFLAWLAAHFLTGDEF